MGRDRSRVTLPTKTRAACGRPHMWWTQWERCSAAVRVFAAWESDACD